MLRISTKYQLLHLEPLSPTFKTFVLEDVPLRPTCFIRKYQLSYKTFREFIKEKCNLHNIFITNLRQFVVTGYNLNPY